MAGLPTRTRAAPKRPSQSETAANLLDRAPAPSAKVRAKRAPNPPVETGSARFEPGEDAFVTLYQAPALTRVEWGRRLGARDAKALLAQLRVAQGEALTALHSPWATVNRKARTNAPLSPAEGERVLGFARLLGQVQTMVRQSGDGRDFDAPAWLSAWMSVPAPALGGARPLDLMDTMTGQALVSQTLAQMQSGAYA